LIPFACNPFPVQADMPLCKSQKKARQQAGNDTGSNVSNVVLFYGRATVEAQMNNNHSYYHL